MFSAIIDCDPLKVRLAGHYIPAEAGGVTTDGHDEYFDEVEVWLVGDGDKEIDITNAVSAGQYEKLCEALMTEWKNR